MCSKSYICYPWHDAKGHNYDEPGTELFRNDRIVSRVGLNHISQHIELRGKTNKSALFSPFTNLYWGHFQAKFHLQYKIYSTVHKAASRQITYLSYYTMLTNESRSKTLIRVAINFPYHTFYVHMGTRNRITELQSVNFAHTPF
jgi:hypothetical protein